MHAASISLETQQGFAQARLAGAWTLAGILPDRARLERELVRLAADPARAWSLRHLAALDSVGALLLWRAWGERLPPHLDAEPAQIELFQRIAEVRAAGPLKRSAPPRSPFERIIAIGAGAIGVGRHALDMVALVGRMVLDLARLARHPGQAPWRETSANLYKGGVLAMPVTALVGFLIGVVLSYLSALQLQSVGADIFIVNILGIGIIREIGPVLVAVLVAGRSGSAMTAQLGVMRVTEEIDALAVMGVSRTIRLVLPKIAALAVAMPFLVLWTSAVALVGGMISAQIQLDIAYGFFLEQLPKTVPVANLWIGLAKGFVFGILVALVACHFGLRVRPNTESLAANTTASVVTSITAVILVDAIFAIATRNVGVP